MTGFTYWVSTPLMAGLALWGRQRDHSGGPGPRSSLQTLVGERPKKPVPLQDQTVRDEKGRYKRFHGAFSGGFSAGYFNTVGSKEGWTPSTFVSSRQNRADKSVLGPEDFMDEEDLSEFGIAPKAIVTTDDFASKTKDRIREKARQLAAAAAPIPGATLLDDLITPAKPESPLIGVPIRCSLSDLEVPTWSPGSHPECSFAVRTDPTARELCLKACVLQAFGVGALEDEDDDIYATETLSKYDTVLKDEEPGDGLYGWTAPKQYKSQKAWMDFLTLALSASVKIYPPPQLPRDYRPVHYFRPMVAATSQNAHLLQVLSESSGKAGQDPGTHSRHQLNASKRGELLGEMPVQDRERIKETKQATDLKAAQAKARSLAQMASSSRAQASTPDLSSSSWHLAMGSGAATTRASNFKPFAKDPEKQRRYEEFLVLMKKGQKDALERCLDPGMTEWERSREREEFARAAQLYVASHSTLSSRFTHAKEEEDSDQVEVPRDQENDVSDKQSAVKMKMFGKLTRDTFEWHPDKLLCKRFNVPDPYPGKPSRWDTSKQEKKEDSISEFLSQARSKVGPPRQEPSTSGNKEKEQAPEPGPDKAADEGVDTQADGEGSRPSMDLFKAIFAGSSDEKSSSSEEEQEDSEDSQEHTEEASFNTSQEAAAGETSVTQEPEPCEPAVPFPIQKVQIDEREEFGPRLPPVFCPNTRQKLETPQKEKPKKSKEKHKTKKEHRRKKEKTVESSKGSWDCRGGVEEELAILGRGTFLLVVPGAQRAD
ncbi:G patch domain containing 1 [Cricetulus griseus]